MGKARTFTLAQQKYFRAKRSSLLFSDKEKNISSIFISKISGSNWEKICEYGPTFTLAQQKYF
jgi:hypothetical protein